MFSMPFTDLKFFVKNALCLPTARILKSNVKPSNKYWASTGHGYSANQSPSTSKLIELGPFARGTFTPGHLLITSSSLIGVSLCSGSKAGYDGLLSPAHRAFMLKSTFPWRVIPTKKAGANRLPRTGTGTHICALFMDQVTAVEPLSRVMSSWSHDLEP